MGRPQAPYDTQSPTYQIWASMKSRCQNGNDTRWRNYGARGIRVCERWQAYTNFLADMGEKPEGLSLDRIDNNGNYEPGNCRWATTAQQRRNSRQNRIIEHDGVTLPVSDWAVRAGIDRNVLFQRLRQRWPIAKALFHPVRAYTCATQVEGK